MPKEASAAVYFLDGPDDGLDVAISISSDKDTRATTTAFLVYYALATGDVEALRGGPLKDMEKFEQLCREAASAAILRRD